MPLCETEGCGKRYIGTTCPYCKNAAVQRRPSMDNSGFGSMVSMFADVESAGPRINIAGNVNLEQISVSGDIVGGDYVEGDKAGGDIDKGRHLIDVGGDYTIAKGATSADGAAPQPMNYAEQSQRPAFCPFCGTSLENLAVARFCPACTQQIAN